MPNLYITAKLDSGASKHYVRPEDDECLTNITSVPATFVGLPDKKVIEITKKGDLTLSKDLGQDAQTGYILKDLKSANLISIGQLADDGCRTDINKQQLVVKKQEEEQEITKMDYVIFRFL